MHSLDTIIIRNAEAAGREAAEADNRGDIKTASKIFEHHREDERDILARLPLSLHCRTTDAFTQAYCRERECRERAS